MNPSGVLDLFDPFQGKGGRVQDFPSDFLFVVYNKNQLSLIHEQLKVGIANQRHPLTSSESSIAQFKKQE